MLESVLHRLIPEEVNTFAKLAHGEPYHFDRWEKDRVGSPCLYYWFMARDGVKKNKKRLPVSEIRAAFLQLQRYPSEEPHLDSGALLLLSSPRRGGEGGEALDGNVSNTWQDGGQVVADRNLHPAAALHDRQNRRHLRSGLLAADVDPVLPAQRHGTHRVLRQIVAQ